MLSSTQNSFEAVSNSVCHAAFFEIIPLHECFLINLLCDLMNNFSEEQLKAAFERFSLLGCWKIICLAEQVRLLGNHLAVCICFFLKKSKLFCFYLLAPAFRAKLMQTKHLIATLYLFAHWEKYILQHIKSSSRQTCKFSKYGVMHSIHSVVPVTYLSLFCMKSSLL